jgi:arsenate reductase
MTFSNTDKEITLIYNSNRHIGKQILAFAQIEKIPIRDIDLVHMKLTTTHWADLAVKIGVSVRDLVNTEDSDFLQKFGKMDQLSEDDWLKLLVNNPLILKAPIVMKGNKIVMMCNPQDMLYFVK